MHEKAKNIQNVAMCTILNSHISEITINIHFMTYFGKKQPKSGAFSKNFFNALLK